MDIAIVAIGTANPKFKRAQLETAELIAAGLQISAGQKRLLRAVYKATGIDYRYSVLSDYCKSPGEFEFFPNDPAMPYPSTEARMKVYKENALALALAAIDDCLSPLNNFKYDAITHVITVSCTGMYAPGIDIEIVQTLKLRSSAHRTTINFMGCYGAFNAMKLAHAICQADGTAKVLIVSVEICTIHFQHKMDMDNLIANSIFADGAAAILIQAVPALQSKYFVIGPFYCDIVPQTHQEMAWHIGNQGFDIVLSSYVPEVIKSGIVAFSQKLLDCYGSTMKDIDIFAIHPGGFKILQVCEQELGITPTQNRYSYEVLRQYGNMSSATVLFVLKEIWKGLAKSEHNKTIFSCAFGPGLTLESMALRVGAGV